MTTSRSEAARSSRQPLSLVPDRDCPLCPRLVAFREANRAREPLWHNAPVAPFGDIKARLLIVGLAPGMQGANRTGRPFTGDYAGDLLYATLLEYGFAKGQYQARPDDGLKLVDCRIANAVHCVPPQNKPLPVEINTCRQFLAANLATMPNLRAIVALGRIAHDTVLKPLNLPTMEVAGETLIKRLALVVDNSRITHVFYPVFPPDRNAGDVLAWLKQNRI